LGDALVAIGAVLAWVAVYRLVLWASRRRAWIQVTSWVGGAFVFLTVVLTGGVGELPLLTGVHDPASAARLAGLLVFGLTGGMAAGWALWFVQIGRHAVPGKRFIPPIQGWMLAASLLGFLVLWGLPRIRTPARSGPGARGGNNLNVILVVVDALRPDHLSCHGYYRHTSPRVDSLARSGIRFSDAMTAATYTTTSIASLFTSCVPAVHGVRTMPAHLEARSLTLAEVLREHGYATGAVVANPLLTEASGFGQGFEDYDVKGTGGEDWLHRLAWVRFLARRNSVGDIGADAVTQSALSWLSRHRAEPFFLYLHYMDVHGPVNPPLEYVKRFDPGPLFPRNELERMLNRAIRNGSCVQGIMREPVFTPEQLSQRVAIYDAAISYVDEHVGQIMERLRELGLAGRTLVVIMADHGEALGEHDQLGHGPYLYQNTIHVPLIFSCAGRFQADQVVSETVSLLDVAPTVLGCLGLEPVASHAGRNLLPVLEGEEPTPQTGLFVSEGRDNTNSILKCFPDRLGGVEGKSRSLRAGRWKVIYSPRWGSPWWELYDVVSDREEKFNRFDREAGPGKTLRKELLTWMLSHDAEAGVGVEGSVVDEETKRSLRVLGYLY
jgi:arylsulfatase